MMAKRIFGLFLALCLIVGMMPMVVSGADEAAKTLSLKFYSGPIGTKPTLSTPTMSIGMAPTYWKTSKEGVITKDGTVSEWNLKFEWPADGVPTITMNNATLINDSGSTSTRILVVSGSADLLIQLQGKNELYSHPSYTKGAEAILAENTGSLSIIGIDKTASMSFIHKAGSSIFKKYGAVTLKNAEFNFELGAAAAILAAYTSAGYEDKTDVTVESCRMTVTGSSSSTVGIVLSKSDTYLSNANTSDITFKNSIIRMTRTSTNWNDGYGMIRCGTESDIRIDRCDMYINSKRYAFKYAPYIENCGQPRAGYNKIERDFNIAPKQSIKEADSGGGLYGMFEVYHICLNSDPVEEHINLGDCRTADETVTYCVVCNKRTVISRDDFSTKNHTPGNKTLVSGSMTMPTNQGHYSVTTMGTYTVECTCSVCGEIWTETEEYLPAVLQYITPSADYHTTGDKTVPQYQLNVYWNDQNTGYLPSMFVLPGETVYFATELGTNSNIPTNAYMRLLSTSNATDKAVIDAGTWNIKLEYPIGGTPVLTMQDATIINCYGLWYGYAGFRNLAPLTVVLKGENKIRQPRYTNGGGLNFKTGSSVTITGDGSLDLFTYGNYAGIRNYGGDLIFDHANIQYTHYTSGSAADAVRTQVAGDIIIDGGTFNMIGANPTEHEAVNGFNSAGDIIIKGGADVSLTNALSIEAENIRRYMLKSAGNITISESSVRLACVYDGFAIKCGGGLTLDYTNGFTANAANTLTKLVDGVYVYPDLAGATKLTTEAEVLAKMSSVRYLDIAPNKALANFTGTAVTVKEDLDVNFKLDANKIDTTSGTVKFTYRGEEKTYDLSEVGVTEGNDYIITLPGLPAKEMTTEITVTIYDTEGKPVTETKTDSVQAYALRLLRDGKYDADTEINNALKTFLVDMLIYGSMAQTRFLDKENVGTLPTAALNAKEWSYATKELTEEAPTTKPDQTGYVGTAFDLKSDIGMAIALDAKVLTDVASAVVTYNDYLGNPQRVEIKQPEASSNKNYTIFLFSNLTAVNGRQDINWTFYDSNGIEVLTITDSLAAYVGRMRDEHPDLDEMLKYCDSAATYFILLNAESN